MSSIIKVTNLTKQFDQLKAVDRLSFSVPQGGIYGFLGQNGAGKSTTIRMLLTLVTPTEGSIEILGMDLQKHRKEILSQTGAIIEKPDLYKYLTAIENLRLFAAMSGKGISETKLMNQLELVGLAGRMNSKVKTFSQGMKQRLGIAIALIHDPQLVILDEPTNGLDPQGIADVRNMILHLSKNLGKTIFVSSHLLNEIEQIADSMLIIDKGKKMAEGKAGDLFNQEDMTVELQTPDNEATIQKLLQSQWKNKIKEYNDERIMVNLRLKDRSTFAKELIAMDIEILALYPRHSLEDYFLSLTTANQHVDSFKN